MTTDTRLSLDGLTEAEALRLARVATKGKSACGKAIWYRVHLPRQWAKWTLEGSRYVCIVQSATTPGKTYRVQRVNGTLQCDCPSRGECKHQWFAVGQEFQPYVSPEALAAYRAEKAANRAA